MNAHFRDDDAVLDARDMQEEMEIDNDSEGRGSVPCCFCGKPTTWDPTYQNLCYRCIRAENE